MSYTEPDSEQNNETRPCNNAEPGYSTRQQQQMLELARASIVHGEKHGQSIAVSVSEYDTPLQQIGCCFITLHKGGQLRGCIGALNATRPLIQEVVEYAYAAAFKDPRFPPVSEEEIEQLHISISILTPQQELQFDSEADLLNQLTPFEDGLTIEDKHHRATFLPSVWESLPDKAEFLRQLKLKAGLGVDHWSDNLRAYRYHTIAVSE